MARNVLIFNLCFVFDAAVKTARYELVLKKVANYLKSLEVMISLMSSVISVRLSLWTYCNSVVCGTLLDRADKAVMFSLREEQKQFEMMSCKTKVE